jgi:hypothetical protein
MKIRVVHGGAGEPVEAEVHPAVAEFLGRWLDGGEMTYVPGWVRCVDAGGAGYGVNLASAVVVERVAEAGTVTGITPTTAVCGGPDVTLHVQGTGFTPATVILFNGLEEPTVFVSATDVTTVVKPSLFLVPADCPVSVVGAGSAPVTFSFTAALREAAIPPPTEVGGFRGSQ